MNGSDIETVSWLRILVAFGTIAGLLGLLAYGLKYISLRGMQLPGLAAPNKRLKIVESLAIDVKRRLVIIRRDDVEHLLLLGANQDIVVETNLNNAPAGPVQTK